MPRRSHHEYEPFRNVERRNRLQERVEVPALIRSLRLPTGARMLEVGCGRGVALPPLAALCRPASLTGLDVDPALLAEAERRLERRGVRARLVHGDVRALPFPDASFDVVIDFGTCWHIAGAGRALSEIERVLAPGGRFVHETVVSQRLAHPVRSRRGGLPWSAAPRLERERSAVLWSSRRR
ncbi:MAG TPA: class I SAM-dependent methyltransferase [Solirubrobacteraceae bacterium]|jgi:ubiquinone/menaquinone biosynthesis C-methylase UbiE|nr:class I SAM-dependent methyltransferase [Solirubrobacteraceae bacterium]